MLLIPLFAAGAARVESRGGEAGWQTLLRHLLTDDSVQESYQTIAAAQKTVSGLTVRHQYTCSHCQAIIRCLCICLLFSRNLHVHSTKYACRVNFGEFRFRVISRVRRTSLSDECDKCLTTGQPSDASAPNTRDWTAIRRLGAKH